MKLVIGGHNEDDAVQTQMAQTPNPMEASPHTLGPPGIPARNSPCSIPIEQAESGHVRGAGRTSPIPPYTRSLPHHRPPGAPEEIRNDPRDRNRGGIALSTRCSPSGARDNGQCAFCSWLYSSEYSTAPSQHVRLFGFCATGQDGPQEAHMAGMEIVNKADVRGHGHHPAIG